MDTLNLNDTVRVKVTRAGERVYERHYQALKMQPPALVKDADGWSKFQLWEVAQIFGAAMYNGCEVPIETTILVTE